MSRGEGGLGVAGEIERALAAGYDPQQNPEDIVFTADLIDDATLDRVKALQIPVNAGSIDMLSQLGEVSPGHRVWLRVNPGFGHGHSQKTNTGGENSKHGIWYSHLPAALEVMRRYQLQLVGIHMHIGSGVDYGHLEQVCGAMVRQVVDFGQDLQAISPAAVCRFLTAKVKRPSTPPTIMACGTAPGSRSRPIWGTR